MHYPVWLHRVMYWTVHWSEFSGLQICPLMRCVCADSRIFFSNSGIGDHQSFIFCRLCTIMMPENGVTSSCDVFSVVGNFHRCFVPDSQRPVSDSTGDSPHPVKGCQFHYGCGGASNFIFLAFIIVNILLTCFCSSSMNSLWLYRIRLHLYNFALVFCYDYSFNNSASRYLPLVTVPLKTCKTPLSKTGHSILQFLFLIRIT